MTCGFLPQSASPANRKCPIAAGSTIGIQWHHQSAAATDDIIDPTHLGPIIVYLAKSDTGAGNVWFKIYEDGYTAADGKWAVDRLLANAGLVNVPLPSDIAPGNYLLRGELIALHGANALNGVQPYVGCVELTISGSGTANPSGVAFPGYYHNTDPGMFFNLYQAFTSYPIPGPALYVSGSSSSSSGASTVAPTKAPTSAPSTAPTTAPTSAPTSRPTTPASAPTNAPTSAPTSAPTATPPSAPSSADISVQLNGGSNAWWLGVIVSGGGETTVKVELIDSGSVSSWTALVALPYAYIYDKSIQLTLPISIRLTSSTGKQVTLSNVFTSMALSSIDTGKSYASSTTTPTTAAPTTKPTTTPSSAPTTKPTTAPTSAPTTKPTSTATPAPSSGSTKVTVHPSANSWWFALTVSGNSASVAKVELMDAGSVSAFTPMTYNQWGYSFASQGSALVTPLTVRVTSASGQSVTATISTITPDAVIATSGQL